MTRSGRGPARTTTLYHRLAVEYLGGKCKKCGVMDELQLDHIVPISEGGSDETSNLQLLCYSCHVEKHLYDNSLTKKHIAKALIAGAGLVDLESAYRMRMRPQ